MGEALPRLKTILLLASVVLAGAFLFTACIYTEFTEVDVELGKEWTDGEVEGFLYTNYISVPEGEVVFAVKNEGTFKHDFVVLETDLARRQPDRRGRPGRLGGLRDGARADPAPLPAPRRLEHPHVQAQARRVRPA